MNTKLLAKMLTITFAFTLIVCACQTTKTKLEPRITAKSVQALSIGAMLGSKLAPSARFISLKAIPNPEVGAALFKRYCESCHVTGKNAPRLVGVYPASPQSDNDIAIIRHGLETMPGFRNILTKLQIIDILSYLQAEHEKGMKP